MSYKKKIFFVEDDRDIFELIKTHLSSNGYLYQGFSNGNDFFKALLEDKKKLPDLILLDLMLPDIDGIEICKQIRGNKKTEHVPIIILTARVEEIDKILGLEIGADDYMTKPFSVRELMARIKALHRRVEEFNSVAEKKQDILEIADGRIKIDFNRYKVTHKGKEIKLTTTEFKLLAILVQNQGKVMSRRQILESIWDDNRYVVDRTVDVHIRHLREKLKDDSELIENVRGFGYSFGN